MKRTQILLFVLCFFVSPLIFFTDLTRNPYITQIVVLNMALLFAAGLTAAQGAADGAMPWPQTPLNVPLAGFVFALAASSAIGYYGHGAFYRPAMISQGATAYLFLGTNVVLPFYLSAVLFGNTRRNDVDVDIWAWIGVILLWSVLWLGFPSLRPPDAAAANIWGQFWSGYGALLWVGGIIGACWLCRKNRWIDYLHLALAVGFIASVYGIVQYFNMEFIWPYTLNPYGGRSVSTFGNPNFLSSFNVVLLPIAVMLYAQASGAKRKVYAAVALSLEAALLCSLTRSSWLGSAVALSVLLFSREFRRSVSKNPRPFGFLFGLAAMMAIFWPESSISTGYRLSAMGRFLELGRALDRHKIYSPLYQRVLIWISAWLMGKQNPLTGQGFGFFELFYPFYQGPVLLAIHFLRGLRTHANNAHDEILEYWSQAGILGVGMLLWMWTTFFRAARTHFESRRKEDWVFVAGAAGIAGMLVDNLLNVSLHFAVPAFLFWWVAGLTMAAASPAQASDRPWNVNFGAAWKRTLGAVAAAAFFGAGWYWVKTWNREVHYFAGFKLDRMNDTAGAVAQLEEARSWGPREVNMLYELGNSYAKAQRYAAARQAYLEALWSNAGYDEIYYNIGAVDSAHLGLDQDAVKFLRVSLLINPLSQPAYNSLSDLYLRHPRQYGEQAVSILKQAVSIFPLSPDYWNNLGYLYTLRKQYPQAEEAYSRALAINPDLQIARHNLSALARQTRLPEPAVLKGLDMLDELRRRVAAKNMSNSTIALAQETAELLPQAADAKFLLGTLLLARGRPQEAIGPLEDAVQDAPNNETACMNLADAYQAAGRLGDAANLWRRVLSIDPGNQIAQRELSSIQSSFK
ncbi:MAG TPA: tetratricopeptide repeat protein [Elusimicrobiota bacterium]|nr:tetratricopeptide repeat protein [Elusimicrobiota bacterium]